MGRKTAGTEREARSGWSGAGGFEWCPATLAGGADAGSAPFAPPLPAGSPAFIRARQELETLIGGHSSARFPLLRIKRSHSK